MYIDDIHVINVSFASHCNSWIFDIGSIGMSVIRNNMIEELQWPKRLEKNMVTMHIENKIKGLLCSPLGIIPSP